MSDKSLYERLGGYDAIHAVADRLVGKLKADDKLGRFYTDRGSDSVAREQQLLVDFLCSVTGGPMVYTGRDMKTAHVGMRLDEEDWSRAMDHIGDTLDSFDVPGEERGQVLGFCESLKEEIVEVWDSQTGGTEIAA